MLVVSGPNIFLSKPDEVNFFGSPSKKYGVSVPPLQAYSHSASVGSRYLFPVTFVNHWQYTLAACHDIVIAGRAPFHHPWSGAPQGGVAPLMASVFLLVTT